MLTEVKERGMLGRALLDFQGFVSVLERVVRDWNQHGSRTCPGWPDRRSSNPDLDFAYAADGYPHGCRVPAPSTVRRHRRTWGARQTHNACKETHSTE